MVKTKRKTFEERKEEVDALIQEMEAAIPTYFESPEDLKEQLDFMAQIHNYSARNATLIRNQFKGAAAIASFGKWKEEGFSVQKGEKGIKILVPNKVEYIKGDSRDVPVRYATVEEKKLVSEKKLDTFHKIHYSIGHVFDISQTNAKASDLPKVFPNKWIEGSVENYDVMMNSMKQIATDMNVTVGSPFEELGAAKGAFYFGLQNGKKGHIGLNPRNSELQNVKTMIHELAHAELHYDDQSITLNSAEKEFQAEMVAYSVASYCGLDTKEYSLRYLHDWTNGKELKDQQNLLHEVRTTSYKFIDAIERDLKLEKEKVAFKEVKEVTKITLDERVAELLKKSDKGFLVKDDVVSFGRFIDRLDENDIELPQLEFAEKFKYSVALAMSGRPIDKNIEAPFIQKTYDFIGYESLESHLLRGRKNPSIIENESEADILLVKFEHLSHTVNKYTSLEKLKSMVDEEITRLDQLEGIYGEKHSSLVLGDLRKGLILANGDFHRDEYIQKFNRFFKEKYAAIDEKTLVRPNILIQWSEHSNLKGNTIEPYKQAIEKMGQLESDSHDDLGYYKTRYHLLIPKSLTEDGRVSIVNLDRLDIGDGYYKNPHEQILKEKKPTGELLAALNAEIGITEVSEKKIVNQKKEYER